MIFFKVSQYNVFQYQSLVVYYNLYGEWSLYSILIIKDDIIVKSSFYSRTKNVIILFALTRASSILNLGKAAS